MINRVSIVGLGKLGLPLAACFAERSFETIGVDIDRKVVNSVNRGVSPIVEPRLQDMISKLGGKELKATHSHAEAIEKTDITFVLVATPSNPDGSFSNRYVESALRSLATAFGASQKEYHLFAISSTVAPGSTEETFIPLIEHYSGKKLNVDFGVCYDPDFVALSRVVKDFLNPELVIIGESNEFAGNQITAVHQKMCENEPHIARMSIVSAEIAKMSLNCYITVKISFANSLANICEKIPGADVDAITKAIGVDKRISTYYFQGGLSSGGPCFPRDTRAFITIAKQYGNDAELIKAVEKINRFQDEHLAEIVLRHVLNLENKTIGVLGLSFKPDTPVIVASPAIKLIRELLKHDLRIVVYDPLAMENTRALFNDAIEYVDSAEECMAQSSLCVIMTHSHKFKLAAERYVPNGFLTIVDCWRMIDPSKLDAHVKYIALGRKEP